jgi:hypothetical protein
MSLSFSLGIIRAADIKAVPVQIDDSSGVFKYAGSLHATFINIQPDTIIQWSQLSGDPVTYLNSLDEDHIEFTTTDLGTKTFRCCTNPGTDAELCSVASFYHFPVELEQGQRFSSGKSATFVQSTHALTERNISSAIHYAMGRIEAVNSDPGTPSTPVGDIVSFGPTTDSYTELHWTFSTDDIASYGLTGIYLYDELESGWTLARTYAVTQTRAYDVPDTSGRKKLVFEFIKRGNRYFIDITYPAMHSPGATSVVLGTTGHAETRGTLLTLLSSIRKSTVVEQTLPRGQAPTIALQQSILQRIVTKTSSDSTRGDTGITAASYVAQTTFLQTNVNVT